MDIIELPDYLFPAPCTIQICGPSSSGKSRVAMEIMRYRQHLFSQPVARVVYCYSEYQDLFKNPPGGDIKFHYGMLDAEELEQYITSFNGNHFILVYDDLMSQVVASNLAEDVATKLSHHRNFTSINISQNIFAQGKSARVQSLNSQFYILTRTCRDLKQIGVLGSQLFPGKSTEFMKVFSDAVDHPLTMETAPHLLINCHPTETDRQCQLLANIFPPHDKMVLYQI